VKLASPPLNIRFLRKKLRFVQQTMKEHEIDAWITFTREGNEDPLAQDLRFNDLTWRSAAIIQQDGTKTAIVGNLDVEAVKQKKFYDEVHGYASEGAAPKLRQIISKTRPKKIAVNTSYDHGAADGLTTGMEKYLKAALKGYRGQFVSGEDLIIALRARLIPEEVELVTRSIRECEKIYDTIEDIIRPGRKDKQIHDHVHRLLAQKGLAPAWASDHCPSVIVGNSPAGHVGYHNDTIRNGDFVRLDFGVSLQGYCSDIQRNYYVGSGNIPRGVTRMFETARAANAAALQLLRPGIPGYKVDQAARRHITNRGYSEYKHALGHVLGRSTHEIGPLLGPRWPSRYGKQVEKPVQKDMVFTIEPSVTTKYGTCNLEQDVLVTPSGYRELSTRQNDLIRAG